MSLNLLKSQFFISVTGTKTIDKTDQKFWNNFMQEFNIPLPKVNIEEFFTTINETFPDFPSNNLISHNLIELFLKSIEFLKEASGDNFKKKIDSKNALVVVNIFFVTRVLLQVIIQDSFPSAKLSILKDDKTEKKKKKKLSKKEQLKLEKEAQKKSRNPKKKDVRIKIDDHIVKLDRSTHTVHSISHFISKIQNHFQCSSKQKDPLQSCVNSMIDFIIVNDQTTDYSIYAILLEIITLLLTLLSIYFFEENDSLSKNNPNKESLEESDTFPDDWVEDTGNDFKPLDSKNLLSHIPEEKAQKLMQNLLNYFLSQSPTPKAFDSTWNLNPKKSSFFSRSHSRRNTQKFIVEIGSLPTYSLLLLTSLFQIDKVAPEITSDLSEPEHKDLTQLEIQVKSQLTFQKQIQYEFEDDSEKEKTVNEQESENEFIARNSHLPSNIYLRKISQMISKNSEPNKEEMSRIEVDFQNLFHCLTSNEKVQEHAILFLYYLTYNNWDFLLFSAKNKNLTSFLMILLEELYQYKISEDPIQKEKAPFTYLILVFLLILSERYRFKELIFSTNLQTVSWFKERQLTNISLGQLTIIILLQITHFHLLKFFKDEIFSIGLAILNNLAPFFANISSQETNQLLEIIDFVSQKVKDYSNFKDTENEEPVRQIEEKAGNKKDPKKKKTEKKSKKQKSKSKKNESINEEEIKQFEQMLGQLDIQYPYQNDFVNIESVNPPPTLTERPKRLVRKDNRNMFIKYQHEKTADFLLYSDYLLKLFSLINTALTNQFASNSQLIYTLLKNRRIFSVFTTHPVLWKYVSNFHKLDKFFDIDSLEKKFSQIDDVFDYMQSLIPKFLFQEKGFFFIENKIFRFKQTNSKNNIISLLSWFFISKNSSLHWDFDSFHLI
ncbi:dymeclin [Anaeramoeba ignava]|uniref:Dymeclin n=1 Tax=Anaeramoeba ignava TaxID=1746090 RepID=A0A9Q0LSL3_ANAIG|nr:dymeclin [Anaeramoeba ignava]